MNTAKIDPLQPHHATLQCQNDPMEKMYKVALQAFEQRKKDQAQMPNLERIKILAQATTLPWLNIRSEVHSNQGKKPSMEDAHFIQEMEGYTCLGIFDGHGGADVSNFACNHFQTHFSGILNEREGQVRQAFNAWFELVDKAVLDHKEWQSQGSTALICMMDLRKHLIFTATLGDSEAHLFRQNTHLLPLSCIRNWGHPKEAQRAADALNNPSIATSWPQKPNPKALRFPPLAGPNVSRTIGDHQFIWGGKRVLLPKPKISVCDLNEGDILVLSCDGLTDFVLPEEMVVQLELKSENSAETLVDFALNEKKSRDNVTVIIVKVESQ